MKEKTSKRQMALTIFSGICGLGALMGTLPVDSANLPMPSEWRPYIISVGFAGLTIEKWGKFIITWINNYKIDNGTLSVLLTLSLLLLPSCGLQFTEDGCVLGQYDRNGVTYAAGPCVGADSQINRYRVQWSNADGRKLRATYWVKEKKPVLVEYFTGTIWLQWSSKDGVVIGPLPPEVQKALDGKPEPIPAPKLTETLSPEIQTVL